VKVEALEETLDRFARFFSEPLLTKDCTDREINAVDSEFQAGTALHRCGHGVVTCAVTLSSAYILTRDF
jgi:hypothetical protein